MAEMKNVPDRDEVIRIITSLLNLVPYAYELDKENSSLTIDLPRAIPLRPVVTIDGNELCVECSFGRVLEKSNLIPVMTVMNKVNSKLLFGRFYVIPESRKMSFSMTHNCYGEIPLEHQIMDLLDMFVDTIEMNYPRMAEAIR